VAVAAPVPTPRLALEVVPAVLLIGVLLWRVREVLTPLVVYALLCFVLWPRRRERFVAHILVTTGALTAIWFLYQTGSLLAPFLLALGIAYLLAPPVAALERRKVPRWFGAMLVLLPFLAALATLLVLLVPIIQRQIDEIASRLPGLMRQVADQLLELRTRFLQSSGGLLSEEQTERLRNLQPSDLVELVEARWQDIARRIWGALLGVGRGVGAALTVLAYVVVTPVVTFYLLTAWPRFTARLEELVPPVKRADVFGFLGEYDRILGRYVRGQLTEAVLVAVMTGIGLSLLGFPSAILMAVVAGLGNLIPYVGLPLSLVPGILIALVSGSVLPNLLKLGAVSAAVQFVDGSITGPRIVGGSVGLNPVWVMIALALFGTLLGFVGLIVAIPLSVLVKMLAHRALERYRSSDYYRGTAPLPHEAP
jgi:predicted PurR-regulated permease PerM